jgi:hypothetical protein
MFVAEGSHSPLAASAVVAENSWDRTMSLTAIEFGSYGRAPMHPVVGSTEWLIATPPNPMNPNS